MRRRNSDEDVRSLERQAHERPGDMGAARALVRALARSGVVEPWLVEVAARAGHEAVLSAGFEPHREPRFFSWFGPEAETRKAEEHSRRWESASHRDAGHYIRGLAWWEDNPGVEDGPEIPEGELDAAARRRVLADATRGDRVSLETIMNLRERGDVEYVLLMLGNGDPARPSPSRLVVAAVGNLDYQNQGGVEYEFRVQNLDGVASGRFGVLGDGSVEAATSPDVLEAVQAAIAALDEDTFHAVLDDARRAAREIPGQRLAVGSWAYVGGLLVQLFDVPSMTVESLRGLANTSNDGEIWFWRLAEPVLKHLADQALLEILDDLLRLPRKNRVDEAALRLAADKIQRWRSRPRAAWFELVPKKVRKWVGYGDVDPATTPDDQLALPYGGNYGLVYSVTANRESGLVCPRCANASAEPWTISGVETDEGYSRDVTCDGCYEPLGSGEDEDEESEDDEELDRSQNPPRIPEDRLLRAIDDVCDPENEEIDCYGEDCALFAVALNRALGGRDEDQVFLGSYNTAMEKKYGSCMYFHVALLYQGKLLDGGGITTRESLLGTVEAERGGMARLRLTDGKDVIEGTDASRFGPQLETEIERIANLLRSSLSSEDAS